LYYFKEKQHTPRSITSTNQQLIEQPILIGFSREIIIKLIWMSINNPTFISAFITIDITLSILIF
jgi:hypothetical protein